MLRNKQSNMSQISHSVKYLLEFCAKTIELHNT